MLPYVGDDIGRDELQGLVERSYASFTHPEVTPLVKVGDRQILELFHGPTAAFKDVALQFLGNLFEFLLQRNGGQLNILGATSGDTGSAAIYGVRGKAGIHIFILHPHNRVSPIQERQMTTVLDANVHNIAIQGNFDDGQRIVKALFNDLAFKQEYSLGAVNSINWARILAQVVYYFYAWGRLSGGDPARQGQLLGAHRQLRRHLRRLCGPAHGAAGGAADPRHQPQRYPEPLRQHRGLRRPGRCTTPSALPWISRSLPTSSATSTTCWTRTRPRCAG